MDGVNSGQVFCKGQEVGMLLWGWEGALKEKHPGSQILHESHRGGPGPSGSAPGWGYAKHMLIYANHLTSPRVFSPRGPSPTVVTRVVGRHQTWGCWALGPHDLTFLGRREGGCRPRRPGGGVSPVNPCPAEATTLSDPLRLTLDTGAANLHHWRPKGWQAGQCPLP